MFGFHGSLKEGIDVSKCGFVVRYTSIATTKAHIQGAGRARHENAEIYYFDNNRRKEAKLNHTARNQSLSLSPAEIRKSTSDISMPATLSHPYPVSPQSGQVNVYNCKQIFNQYCSMSLGSPVQPKKDLYRYEPHTSGTQKMLQAVLYPTPEGWKSKTVDDFLDYWEHTDRDHIFSCPERVKRKSNSEQEEMMFVFLVVVELRKTGCLDEHNSPNSFDKVKTRRICRLDDDWPPAISIKNTIFQSQH